MNQVGYLPNECIYRYVDAQERTSKMSSLEPENRASSFRQSIVDFLGLHKTFLLICRKNKIQLIERICTRFYLHLHLCRCTLKRWYM